MTSVLPAFRMKQIYNTTLLLKSQGKRAMTPNLGCHRPFLIIDRLFRLILSRQGRGNESKNS